MHGLGLAKKPRLTEVGTLFQRLPNLRLAVPLEEVEFTPLGADVGIEKLPVVW